MRRQGLSDAQGGLIMTAWDLSTRATIGTAMQAHAVAAVIICGANPFGAQGAGEPAGCDGRTARRSRHASGANHRKPGEG